MTKRIGTAERRKAPVMLRPLCYSGLELEVTKRLVLVTAARMVVFEHGATLVLCGIEAGGYKRIAIAAGREDLGCRSYAAGVAERGRPLRAEEGQRRSSPDKKLLREEVAERTGFSPKRWLSHA